jgi:hypothetical protein
VGLYSAFREGIWLSEIVEIDKFLCKKAVFLCEMVREYVIK